MTASTVGEIVAYLRMNLADFRRGADEAESRARAIGRVNPDIRIKSNADSIILQLRAVDQAERGVGDSATAAKAPVVNLWAALAAVAPAAVPIAGVAGGALLGMIPVVATLALGIKGITEEFKSGALAGTKYGDDIQQLQGWMAQLKQTAASGLLSGLDRAMTSLTPLFDAVNTDVALMAGQLGQIAAGAVPALVSILTALNPLFVTFGQLLANGAQHLEHWAQSTTGITSFVGYVQAELPTVMNLLGNLVVLLSHLAQGAAPFGGALLSAINAFVGALSKIPVAAWAAMIPVAVSLYAAFKVYAGVTAIVAGVNGALRAMGLQHVQTAEEATAASLATQAATAREAEAVAAAKQIEMDAIAATARANATAAQQAAQWGAIYDEQAVQVAAAAEVEALAFRETAAAARLAAAQITAASEEAAVAARTAAAGSAVGFGSMLPVVGAVVAGLGILSLGFMGSGKAARQAAIDVDNYTASLKADNGVIGENTRLTAANALQKDGAFAAAKKLGISAKDVTDAVLGNADAIKRVNAEIDKAGAVIPGYASGVRVIRGEHLDLYTAIEKVKGALGNQSEKVKEAIANNQELDSVMAHSSVTMGSAASAATTLALAMQALVDANISNAQAQNQMDSALASSAQRAAQEQQAIASAQQQSASASQQLAAAQDAVTKASIAESGAQRTLTAAQAAVTRAVEAESAAHHKLAVDQAASTKAAQAAADARRKLAALQADPNASAASIAAAQSAVTKADAAASKSSKQVAADKKAEAAAQLAITTAKNRAAAAADAEKNAALQMAAAQRQVTSAQQAATSAATALAQAYAAASKALDGMSAAAVQNRGDLIQQISSAEAVAKTYDTGKDGAERYRKKLLELRSEIINNAVANGANRGEVTKYVDSMLKIPKKATTKLELDAAKALKDLTALNKLIAAIVAGAKINAGIADKVFLSGERGASGVAGHNAGGTEDWRGGWSWVGEKGPELRWLPPHSKVMSNAASMSAVAQIGGGSGSGINAPASAASYGGGSGSAAMSNGTGDKHVHVHGDVNVNTHYPIPDSEELSVARAMSMASHQLGGYV